jgi:hypothetical protein
LAENLAASAAHVSAVLLALALVAWAMGRGRFSGGAGMLAVSAVVILDLAGGNVGAYVVGTVPEPGIPPLAAGALRAEGGPVRVVTAFTMRDDRWPELGRLESTWRWGRRSLEPAWNVGYSIGNLRDYVGLRDRRLGSISKGFAASNQWARSGLWGVAAAVVPGRPELAERVGAVAPYRVLAVDPELPAWLVEIPHRPRAYLADRVASVDEAGALAFAIGGGEPGVTVVEGAIPEPAASSLSEAGEARVETDLPGLVEVATQAPRAALLVLNDANVPGWTVAVDGRPTPLVAANYLARGIWLEPGEHRVKFEYRTPGLRSGGALAGLAAAGLLAWVGVRRRRRRYAVQPAQEAVAPSEGAHHAALASRARSESRTETSLETPGSSMVTP